jgi:hypothetical protein
MKIKIDVNALKQTANAAIERGRQEKARKEAEELAEKQRRLGERIQAINDAIARIPSVCQEAALRGENKVLVLSSYYVEGYIKQYEPGDSLAGRSVLTATEVKPGFFEAKLKESVVLSPEATELFDSLAQSGLNPYIKFSYDGGGMYEWYEMWIRW